MAPPPSNHNCKLLHGFSTLPARVAALTTIVAAAALQSWDCNETATVTTSFLTRAVKTAF
eukprot:5353672-Lingulodinium_polyedra.AAC.1